MKTPTYFTPSELALLKGKYAGLARKYGVSTNYVRLLVIGERNPNTKLSKLILIDSRKIVELFKPVSAERLMEIRKEG